MSTDVVYGVPVMGVPWSDSEETKSVHHFWVVRCVTCDQ